MSFLARLARLFRAAPTIVANEVELDTTGSFWVENSRDDCNRCGPIGTTRKLSYRVAITSCPVALSGQGFIIDWQRIGVYFTETYRTLDVFPSCEEIASRAVADIVELVGYDRCLTVEVSLGSGDMPTGMKARWTHPEPHKVRTRR